MIINFTFVSLSSSSSCSSPSPGSTPLPLSLLLPPPPLSELQATPTTMRTSSRLQQMQNRLRTRIMKRTESTDVPETPNKKKLDFKVINNNNNNNYNNNNYY